MKTMRVIKGTQFGDRIIYLSPDKAYSMWTIHYHNDLKRLHEVLKLYCRNNSAKWGSNILFEQFCKYVYNNSSKYIDYSQ